MTENVQNPAAQNPSKADTSFLEYEPYWKGFNEILYIFHSSSQSINNVQLEWLRPVAETCDQETVGGPAQGPTVIPGRGQLSASDAAKRLIACAQQLQTSANTAIAGLAGYILTWSQNIAEDAVYTHNSRLELDEMVEVPRLASARAMQIGRAHV